MPATAISGVSCMGGAVIVDFQTGRLEDGQPLAQ